MPKLGRSTPGVAASLAVHLLTVVAFVWLESRGSKTLHPLHLPGTLQGQHLLLTYTLGGRSAVHQDNVLPANAPAKVPTRLPHSGPKPAPVTAAPAVSEAGTGSSGESARGDENVRVALPQVHPRPQPDLSALPHGAAGDVVVDVLIDTSGKVTSATLVKGLGDGIDTTVMQVLRDWTFTPASRNGQNVASEQEILIHYERG